MIKIPSFAIIKNIYVIQIIASILFLVIYLFQEYLRSTDNGKLDFYQLNFKKNSASTNNMIQMLKDSQFILQNKKNKQTSPVSISLSNSELIDRIKNTLEYNIDKISDIRFSHNNVHLPILLQRLQQEIKSILHDLTEFQNSKKIDIYKYQHRIYRLQVILDQYRQISHDTHQLHLEEIITYKNSHFSLVLYLFLLPIAIFLYVSVKNFTVAKKNSRTDRKSNDKLILYDLEVEEIVKERTGNLQKAFVKIKTENDNRIKAESSLIKAKYEAEIANHQKSDFINRMSHELRTPMNAILGFSQLLDMDVVDKEHKNYLQEILVAGKHLQEMIDDVLDLSKIESGNVVINLKNISLNDILLETITLVSVQAQDKNITITNSIKNNENIQILADSIRLKEVIVNLLTNAIKYNIEGGSITIDQQIDQNITRLSITDTGKGIEEKNLTEVFEPFNRLGAEFTEIEGSGIGLSIAKNLIELMDGKIGLASKIASGSTFWIELPLITTSAEHNPEVNITSEVITIIKQLTIVYIEDNAANLRLIQNIFKKQSNVRIYSEENAEQGISLIRKYKPDLIILDINLPGMSGFQALKILQEDVTVNNIPVFALSASATSEDIECGLVAGFKRYLTKPIQINEFISAINDELST